MILATMWLGLEPSLEQIPLTTAETFLLLLYKQQAAGQVANIPSRCQVS